VSIIYKWKDDGPKPPVEADVFGRKIEEIEARDGTVKPEAVVAAARDPGSPLHAAFEWDDEAAAEGYRVQQARKWMGALVIARVRIEEGHGLQERAYHAVRSTPSAPLGYQNSGKVMGSRDLRGQVIEQARKDLEAFARRYGSLLHGSLPMERINEALTLIADEAELLAVEARAAHAARKPRPTRSPDAAQQEAM
jgi:hypothetical protein